MDRHILVINAGSSSVKIGLYASDSKNGAVAKQPLWHEDVELQTEKRRLDDTISLQNAVSEAVQHTLESAAASKVIPPLSSIAAVGHRIVHGGSKFSEPVVITDKIRNEIDALSFLAPLHNPVNIAGIDSTKRLIPKAKQIGVFDTAFFTTLSKTSSTYPGPYSWLKEGIKRYGFHGISHHYNALRTAELLKGSSMPLKLVSCHLGNGVSLAAVDDGASVDTTMGFTPLDGLMMGTRPGSLDPGILIFLTNQKMMDGTALSHQLNFESGLKGISGISGDMRSILSAHSKGDERAGLAYKMFIHSLVKNIAAMCASLQGATVIAFSGGIGENSGQVRKDSLNTLSWIGIDIDEAANGSSLPDTSISSKHSKIKALIIKSEEDWMIASACQKLLLR